MIGLLHDPIPGFESWIVLGRTMQTEHGATWYRLEATCGRYTCEGRGITKKAAMDSLRNNIYWTQGAMSQ